VLTDSDIAEHDRTVVDTCALPEAEQPSLLPAVNEVVTNWQAAVPAFAHVCRQFLQQCPEFLMQLARPPNLCPPP